MEFNLSRLSAYFTIVAFTLSMHAVNPDLLIYSIDCVFNNRPYCCQARCNWEPGTNETFSYLSCRVSGKNMTCNINGGVNQLNVYTPTIRHGSIKSGAHCEINHAQGEYEVSCSDDKKPICCHTPCEWDPNFLNATCQMTGKKDIQKMNCTCIGDNAEQMVPCFINIPCPRKPNNEVCVLETDDKCYINQVKVEFGDPKQSGLSEGEGSPENTEKKNCDSPWFYLTICLGILSTVLLVYIGCIGKRKGWKILNICSNDQGRQNPAEPRNCGDEDIHLAAAE
ncbi:uncharacterized protein LOC127429860 isoform X2 [Myxocyprinus asiaticus]|uniref:uncharacterized protein LOC127429860 isoform X2 n=1 Tax=Myxocyprinus asiaticus TaxID=70543 RepID=UPI002221A45F|nr:uncharacterized protein LOC127429860 isoform X2 [Myxocyprinus asiaticus]